MFNSHLREPLRSRKLTSVNPCLESNLPINTLSLSLPFLMSTCLSELMYLHAAL